MAKADITFESLIRLEDEGADLRCLLDAFSELSADAPPSWLVAVQARADALYAALEDMGKVVRRDVLPFQRDLASITKPNGGMGAMAPMGTQKADGQLVNTRK